jgi:hypothetical protein
MKENGWVVGILWVFEPFSHGNHHIRVYMHHVCLIQSISARKAYHMKLGSRSGSSQCQLQFGTRMVSIGWSGCEWLPSECKNAHFQAFSPLAPSDKLLGYIVRDFFVYCLSLGYQDEHKSFWYKLLGYLDEHKLLGYMVRNFSCLSFIVRIPR